MIQIIEDNTPQLVFKITENEFLLNGFKNIASQVLSKKLELRLRAKTYCFLVLQVKEANLSINCNR